MARRTAATGEAWDELTRRERQGQGRAVPALAGRAGRAVFLSVA